MHAHPLPVATSTRGGRPRRVQWALLAVVPIIAAGLVGCTTQPSTGPSGGAAPVPTAEPTSVDGLASLLITPAGRTGSIKTADGASVIKLISGGVVATPGVRWGAKRTWSYTPPGTDPMYGHSGTIALSQYDTLDNANAARLIVQRLILGTGQTGKSLPGHPDARTQSSTVELNGHSITTTQGVAQVGTLVVGIYSVGETEDFIEQTLAQQIDHLPRPATATP